MRILYDKAWELYGTDVSFHRKGGFVFRHREFGDFTIVTKAKYVIERLNITLYLDVDAEDPVSVAYHQEEIIKRKLPSLARCLKQSLKVEDEVAQLKSVLQAQ